MKVLFGGLAALLAAPVESFLATRIAHHSAHLPRRFHHETPMSKSRQRSPPSPLHMSSNNNNNQQQQMFDLSKPVFDIYAGRQVRGDALARYNTLNQSEPLRINICAFGVLFFLALPALLDEVSRDGTMSSTSAALVSAAGSSAAMSSSSTLSLPQMSACYVSAAASAVVFWQQRSRRSRQLTRFEKELQAVALSVRLPNNVLADRPYGDAQTIRALQQQSTLRLVALSGNASQLREALQELQTLRQRLVQSSTYVVVVPTDAGSSTQEADDWGLGEKEYYQQWLVQPGEQNEWRSYFESLSANKETKPESSLQWFVLSATGRSVGSGTSNPSWLQLMGQHMRPTVLLDPDDELNQGTTATTTTTNSESDVIKLQQESFYKALTTGNLKDMDAIFGKDDSGSNDDCGGEMAQAVTSVIQEGGRLDEWKSCLEDGARPAGLVYGNSDVTILDDGRFAYSTCVEFPALEDMGSMAVTPTLLAVQKWARRDESSSSSSSSSSWKLVQHQTIPWTDDRPAGGTLICDCRGCVSLVRGGSG